MNKELKASLERDFRSARRDLSFDDLVRAALPFFESVDTPISLGIYLRLKYKEYKSYLELEINPLDYNDADSFFKNYECAKLFSKAEFFPSIIDTRKAAERNFIKAEALCQQTNDRFYNREDPVFSDPVYAAIIERAKRKISRILGPVPKLADLDFSFGPGKNVGLVNERTSSYDKLKSHVTLTRSMVPVLKELRESHPFWLGDWAAFHLSGPRPGLRYVPGSKLGFVPKNAKTDRAICVEPILNSYVQSGIGNYMRKRLASVGCNLARQGRNQGLAQQASRFNDLATVDLAAASDTISIAVVLELLPPEWVDLLGKARCDRYSYQNNTYEFNKWSSMGNGYTFELESLIFYALSIVTCQYENIATRDVSVYGDDIIIPTESFPLFEKIISYFGFEINLEKSFSTGPFRESCGKDYYFGTLVRPLFMKRRPTNATLMYWCNHLWRMSEGLLSTRHASLYHSILKLIPRKYHVLKGPDGYGDGHLVTGFDQFRGIRHSKRKRGWEGKGFYTIETRSLPTKVADPFGVFNHALYSAQKRTDRQSSSAGFLQVDTRKRFRTVLTASFAREANVSES